MNTKTEKNKDREIFIKYGPLLDPLKYLAGKYIDEDISMLPSFETNSKIDKVNDHNNSAYVDSFMTYLTSNLLHCNNFFHGLDFYGSFLGIKQRFEYDIVDDMEAIHNNSFFHKNNKKLFDLPDNIDTNYFDNSSRNYKNRLTIGDCDSVLSISSFERKPNPPCWRSLALNPTAGEPKLDNVLATFKEIIKDLPTPTTTILFFVLLHKLTAFEN